MAPNKKELLRIVLEGGPVAAALALTILDKKSKGKLSRLLREFMKRHKRF